MCILHLVRVVIGGACEGRPRFALTDRPIKVICLIVSPSAKVLSFKVAVARELITFGGKEIALCLMWNSGALKFIKKDVSLRMD